jgi:hypothetical protein
MKKLTLLLCGIIVILSSSFYFTNDTESFDEKTEHYYEIAKTAKYKELVSVVEKKSVSEAEKLALIEILKIFEGSTIEELKTIFEVEASAADGCYWVTSSTSCQHCRHSLFKCGIFTPYKPCTKYQLEYCGSYWSGNYRFQGYTVCCN